MLLMGLLSLLLVLLMLLLQLELLPDLQGLLLLLLLQLSQDAFVVLSQTCTRLWINVLPARLLVHVDVQVRHIDGDRQIT